MQSYSIETLKGKNIVVYDLEIKTPIDECPHGWNGHDEMGISVACAYDYREGRYRLFMDDNMGELVERLNEPDTLIVAFNQISFDNKVLRACCKKQLLPDDELNNYDMLHVSKIGAGLTPDARISGFKLDQHLKALDLPMKTGDGAMAPLWWKGGRYGHVADYCLADVASEKALFEYFWVHGKAATAYRMEQYPIRRPEIEEKII